MLRFVTVLFLKPFIQLDHGWILERVSIICTVTYFCLKREFRDGERQVLGERFSGITACLWEFAKRKPKKSPHASTIHLHHVCTYLHTSPLMMCQETILPYSFHGQIYLFWHFLTSKFDSKMGCWCVREASMLLTISLTRPTTVGPRRLSQMAVGSSCL